MPILFFLFHNKIRFVRSSPDGTVCSERAPMEYIQSFVIAYGYPTIFFLLYFGLLGLPCAEESFLLLVGITLTNRTLQTALPLNLPLSVLIAIMGSSAGMVTAFLIGYYI